MICFWLCHHNEVALYRTEWCGNGLCLHNLFHIHHHPNVSLITAGHPIHPQSRNSGYEYGREIHIGDNVWIGCGAIVNPGVSIDNNVVEYCNSCHF